MHRHSPRPAADNYNEVKQELGRCYNDYRPTPEIHKITYSLSKNIDGVRHVGLIQGAHTKGQVGVTSKSNVSRCPDR